MIVSNDLHHGRHLRLAKKTSESSVFTDIRISDIIVAPMVSDPGEETVSQWLLLGTNYSSDRISMFGPYSTNTWTAQTGNVDRNIVHVKEEMKSDVMMNIKNEVSKLRAEVSSLMKDEVSVMKEVVASLIQEEVSKHNKPLEDKMEHVTRLLERILAALP